MSILFCNKQNDHGKNYPCQHRQHVRIDDSMKRVLNLLRSLGSNKLLVASLCHLPLNLSHLLITFPALEHARAGLRAQCLISQLTFDIESVLHVDFPAETLIAFLRQTDLSTSI